MLIQSYKFDQFSNFNSSPAPKFWTPMGVGENNLLKVVSKSPISWTQNMCSY